MCGAGDHGSHRGKRTSWTLWTRFTSYDTGSLEIPMCAPSHTGVPWRPQRREGCCVEQIMAPGAEEGQDTLEFA